MLSLQKRTSTKLSRGLLKYKSARAEKVSWTVGRPVSQAQKNGDSHSSKEEDLRTLTNDLRTLTENRATKTQLVPNVQAKPLVPNNQNVTKQDVSENNKKDSRPNAPPPHIQQNNAVQPTDTVDAQVCYYHQTFGEKARLCSELCSYYKMIGQREVANIASYPAKLLYVDDKRNKCKYLIDTGAAVSVLRYQDYRRRQFAPSCS